MKTKKKDIQMKEKFTRTAYNSTWHGGSSNRLTKKNECRHDRTCTLTLVYYKNKISTIHKRY